MNRGTTLLEVVVSIALLAGLMIVLTSWTRLFGAVDGSSDSVRWNVAAESVLQRIHEDLLVGDFSPVAAEDEAAAENDPAPRPAARARIDEGDLLIATRRVRHPGGSVLHVYARDANSAALTVGEQQPRAGAPRPNAPKPRVLLDRVAGFECALDDESGELRVEIVSDTGSRESRRYRLP